VAEADKRKGSHETVCHKVQYIESKTAVQHCRREQAERLRHKARKGIKRKTEVAVFVLDKRKNPLMPCEKRARLLLGSGRARVHRLIPFTIRIMVMLNMG
jgi:hypothetical protein